MERPFGQFYRRKVPQWDLFPRRNILKSIHLVLVFEPNVSENEDYKPIFDEFKNLVDFMLGNFMEDIGISPEQFEEACSKGHTYPIDFNHVRLRFKAILFEIVFLFKNVK